MRKNINPVKRFLSAWKKKITGKTFRISLLWFFGFFSVMLFFYKSIRFEWTIIAIIYFIFLSWLMLVFQRKIYQTIFKKTNIFGYITVFLALVIHFSTALIGQKMLWEIKTDSSVSFLNFDTYFVYAKPFDVLFQEIIIIWLIYTLHMNYTLLRKTIGILIVFFGVSHTILIYFMWAFWGIYFTVFAVIGSIILPILITRFRNGWAYAYALHLCFYSVSAVAYLLKSQNIL
jgi:hypothetical protein